MKYCQSILKAAFLIAAFAVMCSSVKGQNPTIHLTFNPPVSPYLADWTSRASTATIRVDNPGATRMCKIRAEISINGVLMAFTKVDKLMPLIIPPGPSIFNGEDIAPISAAKFTDNVDRSSQRAGRIPDGFLCVIVFLVDARTGLDLAQDKECTLILSYTPPVLILPLNNSELCRLGVNNVIDKRNGQPMPIFQWTPVQPVRQTPVKYHFAIYEVLPGQAPIAAFRGARSVFERDLIGLTNLAWPIEYFLPEKGKKYVWSVRALDDHGFPFVLTNDGWAEPFTFTVTPNCDQGGNAGTPLEGLLMAPRVLDFGSVHVGTASETKTISLINTGTSTIELQPVNIIPTGIAAGFSISLQPAFYTLNPGMGTSVDIIFKPTSVGLADGSVRIAGYPGITLKGQGTDILTPTIKITSPSGGEILTAGSPFKIIFNASDNDVLTNYAITYSTDGGLTFSNTGVADYNAAVAPPSVMWNIPADLQTSQAIIKITAKDKSGNTIEAVSGLFSIGDATGNPGSNQNNGNGSSTNGNNSSGQNGNSSTGGSDPKTKNTNMTDVYAMKIASLELEGNFAGVVESVEGGNAIRSGAPPVRDEELAKEGFAAKKHIAGVKYEDITLTSGTGMGKPMLDWIQNSFDHKYTRKSGAIIMADYDYKELSRLTFYHGLISEIGFPALDAASKDAAKMTIKFQPEMSNFVKIDPSKPANIISRDAKVQKKWLPSNFRLNIAGLDDECSKVNKIEAITIKQKNVENAVGEMRDYKIEPGHLEMPNLSITLPESHSAGFKEWYEKSVINGNNGKGMEKNGSLEYLAEDGTPLFTLTFHNLGIFKMTPDKVEAGNDSIKKIKIEMYVEEIKFDYKAGDWK